MAKAGNKSSTPRGVPLTVYFYRLLAKRYSHPQAMQQLAALLTSVDMQVSPPLPPTWHLEIGPRGELLVVSREAIYDGRAVFLYQDPFKPVSPPAAVIAALYPDATPSETQSGRDKDASRPGPQIRRALALLPKLYPPDGKVPADVSTEEVRGRVNTELASDSELTGKAEISWHTMNRALGRTRK